MTIVVLLTPSVALAASTFYVHVWAINEQSYGVLVREVVKVTNFFRVLYIWQVKSFSASIFGIFSVSGFFFFG